MRPTLAFEDIKMRKEPDLIAMMIVLGMIVIIMTVVYWVVFVL